MRQTKISLTNIVLPALVAASCATTHAVRQENFYQQEENVVAVLEAITAAGQFSVIDAYRNEQIDQHPDKYMNELYNGARVALRHAPNGVYELAVDQYAEDVQEYFAERRYVLEKIQETGGFSFNYDINHDE